MLRLIKCACAAFILLSVESEGQVIGVGNCPDVDVVQDFDASKVRIHFLLLLFCLIDK